MVLSMYPTRIFRSVQSHYVAKSILRSFASTAALSGLSKMSRIYNREDDVVIVDGVRTPFMLTGTEFAVPELSTTELAKVALEELHKKTGIDKELVEYIVMSSFGKELQMGNVSRDSALLAGYPATVVSHMVRMDGLSSFQSLSTCAVHIKSNLMNICIAGGTDFTSDLTTRYPAISANSNTSRKRMDIAAQRLVNLMNVTRKEQDAYALRSHQLAKKAYDCGYLTDVVPFKVPSTSKVCQQDNGVRVISIEQLANLKSTLPSLQGSVTAGNSASMADGASACLLMTEQKAKALGLHPKAYVRDFTYSSQDPVLFPLSASIFSIPKVLEQAGLTLEDIQVWEFLEDFAGQVLANLKAMDSDCFARKFMERSRKIGAPPIEAINAWGGSLAMGFPFAATGVRLCMQAANRLIQEDGHFACVTGVAVGGQGVSIILERHPDAM